MTVAESLRDKLKYNMMMNHDSIEVSDRIFGFDTPAQRDFNSIFRAVAFETAIKHDIDLIFTYVCAFESPSELEYLTGLAERFTASGGNFYFVEPSAHISARLLRLNSDPDEMWFENHIKIDDTYLSPDEVADRVTERFELIPNTREEREYRFGV